MSLSGTSPEALSSPLQILERGGGEVEALHGASRHVLCAIFASALGPLLLAWWAQATGAYAGAFYVLAVTLAVLAGAALVVPIPAGAED